jgi:hypothetical protein
MFRAKPPMLFHNTSALRLLMLGILANDHYLASALDDLAFFTNGFYRTSDFHRIILSFNTNPQL